MEIPQKSGYERDVVLGKIKLRCYEEKLKSHYQKPIEINGSSCYIEQIPLIQSLSIQDNILFGSAMDQERYK